MSKFTTYKLEEIAEVQTGPFGSQLHMSDYKKEGTPIITVEHLGENRIIHKNLPLVGDEDKNRLKKYTLKEGDIVFSRVGSVDRCAYVSAKEDDWMFSGRCLRVRTNDKVDSRFLSFYFNQENFKEYIRMIAVGATMPSINTTILSEVEIVLPPLNEQKIIAETLSSLDDKIDLLHRQNKTLEQLAETLFRQWFVEEAEESWEREPLGKYVTIKRGGSPRPIHDYISETGLNWLKISDVTSVDSPFIFEIKEKIKEEGLNKTTFLNKGSLVLSNSATPGIPKILDVDSCIHDGWLHFPQSKFSKEFLYLLFKYIRPELLQMGNGSIFTNLKTDILKEYVLAIPNEKALAEFDEQVKTIFEKLYSNTTQIRKITQLRDTVLPKLMSGEVRVNQNNN
jgi:type I restriction enzyme S subunit